jgi:hypothetical protein
MRRDITIGDLCELTGYSRDQMRGLLAELPPFASRPGAARVARVYSNHDVLVIVLLCRLETVYALKRGAVAALCEPIANALATPRAVSTSAKLLVRTETTQCEYCDELRSVEDGMVVPLEPVFAVIDSYLVPEPLIQREVGLSATGSRLSSPEAAASSKGSRTARDTPRRQREKKRPHHG